MDLMDYRRKIIASSPHLSHAEGAVASFADGTDLPLKSLIVDIDPVQSGSGDPSPSNIRPISGWDAVGVHDTGKNLFDKSTAFAGNINASGGVSQGSSTNAVSALISVKPNTTYYISNGAPSTMARRGYWYDINGNPLSELGHTPHSEKSYAITSPNGAFFVRLAVLQSDLDAMQFEFGSNATEYSPYTGTSITVQLGRTVYGGTLNVLTGELVVDMAIVDLGTLTWTYSNRFFRANPNPEYKRPSSQRSTISALCTIYTNTTWNDVGSGDNEYAFSSAVTRPEVIIKNSSYTDAAAFKTAMSGVMLCYELATPITYHLDPQTVRSLVGQNNIFSDTGNVALEYWAHP